MSATDYALQRFEEDRYLDEIALDAIDFILSAFDDKVEDNWLSTLEIPYSVDIAFEKIRKMMELATLEHDGNFLSASEDLEYLHPDGEPSASAIDAWARGSVATKKVVIEEPVFKREDDGNYTPSVGSFRSSATGRSKTSKASRRSTPSNTNADLDKTGKIIELDDDLEEEFGSFNSTGQMFDMLQKSKRAKNFGRRDSTNEEVKGEFDILQEQMEKAAKELNGKKFILDRYGKPVVVGKVNVDSLPPFSVPLDLNIKSDDGKKSPYSNRGVSSSDLDIELDAKDKRKPNLRVAGHRSVDSKSFTALTTMSTTLSDIDTIPKVNPGVSIKSATTVRSGSEITEDPSRISRKTYFSRSGSLAGSSSSYAQGKMSKTYGGDSFATEYNSQSYVSNDAPREKRGGRNQNDLLPASMRSIDTLPDIDNPLFDGKPVEETSSVFDPTDEDLGLGPAMTTGMPRVGKLPAKMTAEHKQNIEKLHGKADNGKPRDRDMPKNMRPVKERKHLPAPPLGHIVGHGLSLEKFIEKTTLRAESGDIDWTSQWRG